MSRRPALFLLAAICLMTQALAQRRTAPASAQTAAPAVSVPVQLSGSSPFAAGCEDVPLPSRIYPNSAVEANLAVDPHDPRHLVAVWQQDRFSSGASRANLAAVSHDGGLTWTDSMAPSPAARAARPPTAATTSAPPIPGSASAPTAVSIRSPSPAMRWKPIRPSRRFS